MVLVFFVLSLVQSYVLLDLFYEQYLLFPCHSLTFSHITNPLTFPDSLFTPCS
jgi:hypothetical protein